MNTAHTPARRAIALLAASSLDQKLRWLDEHSANDPTRTTFTTASGGAGGPVHPGHVHDAGAGAVHTDDPVHRRAVGHRRRRSRRDRLPGERLPVRRVGRGARPRQGRRDRPRGVAQAAQRPAGPGHRQRPRPAQRPYVGVPRRGPGARRPAGRRVHEGRRRQRRRAGPGAAQALRRERAGDSTATTAPPTWTDARCARSTPSRTRSRSTAATSARSCAPSTRSTTTGPAATRAAARPDPQATRSASTAGWSPTSARGTT